MDNEFIQRTEGNGFLESRLAKILVYGSIFVGVFLFAFVSKQWHLVDIGWGYTTTVSESVSGGSLTISGPGTASLVTKNVSGSNQTTTATVTAVAPSDLRGTGVGWSVTLTTTNLGLAGGSATIKKTAGTGTSVSASLTATGNYDGANNQGSFSGTGADVAGKFSVSVTTVSGGLPTAVSVTKPDGSTATPTVSSNAFTVNGLTFTFDNTKTYATDNTYTALVDQFPYGQLTDTPGTLAGTGSPAADTTNVTLQSAATFAGSGTTSNSITTLTAAANAGLGAYTYNDSLSWVLHSNPMAGTYNATFTYTAS